MVAPASVVECVAPGSGRVRRHTCRNVADDVRQFVYQRTEASAVNVTARIAECLRAQFWLSRMRDVLCDGV